jgi:perosamine synthetase
MADLTVFSFHPVKPITSGEGGMVVSEDKDWIEKVKSFRNHGISTDFRERERRGTWAYDMADLGFNYRMTDIQAALGQSQLRKLPGFIDDRRRVAAAYDRQMQTLNRLSPLHRRSDVDHTYHLYVVQGGEDFGASQRAELFESLRAAGVGVNVHYLPVYLHSYYRSHLGTRPGLCPAAEAAYERMLSLPIYVGLSDAEVDRIMAALKAGLDRLT